MSGSSSRTTTPAPEWSARFKRREHKQGEYRKCVLGLLDRVVHVECATDAFVDHGEAVVRERLIIHSGPITRKSRPQIEIGDGFSDTHTVTTRRSQIS